MAASEKIPLLQQHSKDKKQKVCAWGTTQWTTGVRHASLRTEPKRQARDTLILITRIGQTR